MSLQIKDLILETEFFIVVTLQVPHIDRNDGGHIIIYLKDTEVTQLSELQPEVASQLILLAMRVGDAMSRSLSENGVDIGTINYQINGNWSLKDKNRAPLHMHIYGRAKSAKIQKYEEALYLPLPSTGFYQNFSGLTVSDVEKIKKCLKQK